MSKELTGRHVFLITASAFAIIISVNVFMAVKAVGTFPGLEVKNSYVASQSFDADRTAQEALGWTVTGEVAGEMLYLNIVGADGAPVAGAAPSGVFGRPTNVTLDRTPEFTFDGARYGAHVGTLEAGLWDLRFEAQGDDGTVFRQRLEFYVK